jgi:hypothetical protein
MYFNTTHFYVLFKMGYTLDIKKIFHFMNTNENNRYMDIFYQHIKILRYN